ncbi:MAG: hypothetical protein P1P89_19720 [Desulfobacterales bacterium]|nr:hypothetical protein [Desulfobacterales bacterium]
MGLVRDYIDGAFKNEFAGEVSIDGFATIAIIRDNIKQTREAPVTYLEDGSHVNDHIIRNPIVVKIEGNISSVYVEPPPTLKEIRGTETIVGEVAQYLPGRTQAQLSIVAGITADIQQRIDQLDSAIRTSQKIADKVGYTGLTDLDQRKFAKSNIEGFIDKINGLLNSDALITISGPLQTYDNMCILAFEYTESSTSEAVDFTIEAQELRFAQTLVGKIAKKPAADTKGQHAGETDKGVQAGKKVEKSLMYSFKERVSR